MDGSTGMAVGIDRRPWQRDRHTFFQMEAGCIGAKNITLRFSYVPKGGGEESRTTLGFRWVEEDLTATDGTRVKVSGLYVEGHSGVMEPLNEKAFPANGYVLVEKGD